MEKHKPHCPLPIVHALVREGKVRTTKSADATAYTLGFSFDDIVKVVMTLTTKDFYKSMRICMPMGHPFSGQGATILSGGPPFAINGPPTIEYLANM
jgi:hypothetical protein